jgi:hypothetical protein
MTKALPHIESSCGNRITLLSKPLLFCAIYVLASACGNPSPQDTRDWRGLRNPWRTDSELVPVSVGSERYRIPANCLAAEVHGKRDNHGFHVEDAVMLSMLWPNGDCRSPDNQTEFDPNGYGNVIYALITPLAADRLSGLGSKLISMKLNYGNPEPAPTALPPPDSRVNGEDVWHPKVWDQASSAVVYVTADPMRTNILSCFDTLERRGEPRGCELDVIHRIHMKLDFAPDLANERKRISRLIITKLDHFSSHLGR